MRLDLVNARSALVASHGDVGARPGSYNRKNNNASLSQAGD